MPEGADDWQARLRAAIEDAYGSVNSYAKHLAGEGATQKQVDAHRRPIQKWLKRDEPTVPNHQSVRRLIQDGIRVDPEMFPRLTKADRAQDREEVADALAALKAAAQSNGQRIDLLTELLEEVRVRVDQLDIGMRELRTLGGSRRTSNETREGS